jgi:hypothetical protein
MTAKTDAEDVIIELVEQVTWGWILLAFALGIAAGVTVLAFVGRERVTPDSDG